MRCGTRARQRKGQFFNGSVNAVSNIVLSTSSIALLVKGSREVAEALAARPDVARIEGNPQIQNVLPQPITTVEAPSQSETPDAIEPNINYTHAPQVWARGFVGRGLVIGTADTGVRWTHNALKSHYRGWNGTMANHNYNWHDSVHSGAGNPCGNNAQAPCDDNGHGTHTIGTAIGDDGMGNQIGMAPGAKWIGCRNMDQGNGTPARYIECMEFFLAPYPVGGTPAQGDPTLAPDITTNSWTCPPAEGCSVNTLRAAVEAQHAAGIMMVVTAGNQGPSCSTVLYPPSFYQASYTVGALTTGTDTIAPFSNRGSVTIDGSHRLKPDITAPGTDIRSSLNTSDTAYGTMTGTSMATPHIAGAVALLWSARPEWRHDIDISRTAINDAAVHILNGACDGGHSVTPNNTYGHGRVDILSVVTRPGPTAVPYDFNNDAYSDLLLFNRGTRQTAVWYMRNNVRIGNANGPTLPGGWSLASVADFNRDDHPDSLLFNSATRATWIWYMNNNVRIGNAFWSDSSCRLDGGGSGRFQQRWVSRLSAVQCKHGWNTCVVHAQQRAHRLSIRPDPSSWTECGWSCRFQWRHAPRLSSVQCGHARNSNLVSVWSDPHRQQKWTNNSGEL